MSNTFTITIKKKDESYTIEAHGQKGIQVDPQPAPQLKNLLSNEQIKATLKSLANEQGVATPHAIQKLGEALYNALFIQPILLAYGKAQGRAKNENGVRLRLRIEPPELAAFPWETLYDGQDWLSTQSTTPLVRQLILESGSKTLQKLQVRGALKILFVGASPKDLPNLNIEKTATELRKLLEESIKKKKIKIVFDVILNATLDELRKELVKDYHILYFTGHGSPEGIFLDDGGGKLLKEGDKVVGREKGSKYGVSAQTLAKDLEGKQTRLVFLAACNTSTAPDESGLLAGFAQELAQRSELPAIVAMQYFISDRQANPLTTQFFAALAAGRPVDVALAEARKPLIRKGIVGRDVFSPVLYLQAEDGTLFQKAKNWPAINLSIALAIAIFLLTLAYQFLEERRMLLKAESASNLLSTEPTSALILSLGATKIEEKSPLISFLRGDVPYKIKNTLLNAVRVSKEINVLYPLGGEPNPDVGFSSLYIRHRLVNISADGENIVSVSSNLKNPLESKVDFWKSNGTSSDELSFEFDNYSISEFAISNDQQFLIALDNFNTVKLLSRHGSLIKELVESNLSDPYACAVTLSGDGKTAAVGMTNGTVRLWNRDSNGDFIEQEPLHPTEESICSVALNYNGQILVAGADDAIVYVRKRDRNGIPLPTKKLYGHKDGISSVAVSNNGQTIAAGSYDGSITWWNSNNGESLLYEQLKNYIGNPRLIITGTSSNVAVSADGQIIASNVKGLSERVEKEGISLWYQDGTQIVSEPLYGHQDKIFSLGLSHVKGQIKVASGSFDGSVRIWKLSGQGIGEAIQGHRERVTSVDISDDGKTIASSSNSTIRLWNYHGIPISKTFQVPDEESANIALAENGHTIITINTANSSSETDFCFWTINFDADCESFRLPFVSTDVNGSPIFAVSNDGQRLVVPVNNTSLQVFTKDMTPEGNPFDTQDKYVVALAISGDGQTIVSGGYFSDEGEFCIKAWNYNGTLIKTLYCYPDVRRPSIDISNVGQIIVAGINTGQDGSVLIWKREGDWLSLSGSLPGHKTVINVAISGDGRTIVSTDSNNVIRVIQPDGTPIAMLSDPVTTIDSVAVNNDGRIIVSGSRNGTVRVWNLSNLTLDGLIRIGCQRLSHHRKLHQSDIDSKEAKEVCKPYLEESQ